MMKLVVAAGAVGLSLVAAAMPTKKELKDVQRVVNELMAGDALAMKDGKMKPGEVAANAETYARDAETEAAKFLFLKGAFGLYVQGEDYEEALRVLNELNAAVKDIPDKVMAEIVVAKLKRISKSKATPIFDYYERLEQRMRMTEERTKLENAVKENPQSKECRRDLAVCLAVLGDWTAASVEFVRAGGKEAEAVAAEKAGRLAPAADLWWESAQGDGADALRAHAAELYRKAIADGKLTGLKLTLAKKRLAELGGAAEAPAAKVAETPREPKPDVAAKPAPAPEPDVADVPALPKNGKYDWSIPKKLKGVKTLDFDLGTTEKLTLFAVPSGEGKLYVGSAKPTSFRVTRPFWIAQFPLTLDQTRSLIKGRDLSFTEPLAEACEGDRTVLAAAGLLHDDITEFFEKMNAKFGHLLPKGWVFRPPTCAEVNVVRGLPFVVGGEGNNQAALLPVLQAKGFYNDCTDANKVRVRCEADGRWVDPGLLLLGADKIRAKKQLKLSGRFVEKEACLDMVSTPDVKEWPGYDRKVCKAVGPILKAGFRSENPFWYCEEDAPNLRNGDGDLTFYLRNSKPYFVIRVVAGYDYVGEWKKKNGK